MIPTNEELMIARQTTWLLVLVRMGTSLKRAMAAPKVRTDTAIAEVSDQEGERR